MTPSLKSYLDQVPVHTLSTVYFPLNFVSIPTASHTSGFMDILDANWSLKKPVHILLYFN